jgi:hypothetical protein
MSFGAPFPASRREVLSTFLAHSEQTATASSYSFTSLSFGMADADRYIVACLTIQASVDGVGITDCTIGGITATQIVQSALAGGRRGAAIFIAKVPTGTSGTVAFTLSGNAANASVAVYSVIGGPAASSTSSTDNAPTASLNIAAHGAVIAVAIAGSGSSPSATWTNLTEDCDNNLGSGNLQCRSSASKSFATAQTGLTTTCTFSTTAGSAGCFAVFEPA